MAKLKIKNSKVIHLKIKEKYRVPYKPIQSDFDFIKDKNFLKIWKIFNKKFPKIVLQPLFTSISEKEINDLINKAIELDPTYKPDNLLSYFFIINKYNYDPIELFDSLNQSLLFDSIEYVNEISVPTSVDPSTEHYYPSQTYLNPAIPINPGDAIGIGVASAWNETNYRGDFIGDGTGVNFIDIEYGWIFDHEDIDLIETSTLIYSTNRTYKEHGTSVLSIVAAKNNSKGCIGIAPNCTISTLGIDFIAGVGDDYANSILKSIQLFGIGDVLLLELQNGRPSGPAIETISAVRALIYTATANKIIVVEAAGNASYNYDAVNPIFPALKPSDANFFDTGAIIVGGVESTTLARNNNGSCYGDRVNCFAWYDSVTAATGPNLNDYTTVFNGTSAASAIIAGVAVVLQGIYKNKFGQPLGSLQMRRILSNSTLNTLSRNPVIDKVGVMPDLNKIIHSFNNPQKDIYIRDNIYDIGDRHLGGIAISPDIITLNAPISLPFTADNLYGTNSGTESTYGLGDDVVYNQDNYVYVRILNKSTTAVSNVTVKVYYAEVATLVTPNRWNFIGSTVIASVPANTIAGRIELTVTDVPIVWQATNIPAAGHYCYVCIIESDDDPAPSPSQIDLANDVGNFIKLIRENNNITWKNFNVVDFDDNIHLPFFLVGDITKKRFFDFYITNTLPHDAIIEFEFPNQFEDVFSHPFLRTYKKSKKTFCVRWKNNKLIQFNKCLLNKGFEAPSKINIFFPEYTDKTKQYQISITQVFKHNIVGKITWQIKKS